MLFFGVEAQVAIGWFRSASTKHAVNLAFDHEFKLGFFGQSCEGGLGTRLALFKLVLCLGRSYCIGRSCKNNMLKRNPGKMTCFFIPSFIPKVKVKGHRPQFINNVVKLLPNGLLIGPLAHFRFEVVHYSLLYLYHVINLCG